MSTLCRLISLTGEFQQGSGLHTYLATKLPTQFTILKMIYSLIEILQGLFAIIEWEGLFDHRNPSIIVCDGNLEKALGVHVLHMYQLKDYVRLQLTLVGGDIPTFKSIGVLYESLVSLPQWAKSSNVPLVDKYQNCLPTGESYCILKPAFFDFLQCIGGNTSVFYQYNDIIRLMKSYIRGHSYAETDKRNPEIWSIGGTKLQRVFLVGYLSKSQLFKLIHHQIVSHQIILPTVSLLCSICYTNKKTISFAHKDKATCFLIACTMCAKIMFKKKHKCPSCRQHIDGFLLKQRLVKFK